MRKPIIVTFALTALLVVGPARASVAQDVLGAVKTLYASAAYEDALAAIERAAPSVQPDNTRSFDEYRAFCLLALGREAEATKAIERVVAADPFFRPDPDEVAPRLRALFSGVRKRLLPAVVQQKYAIAKATYDRKEFVAAAEQFERVIALMNDPETDQTSPGLTDLRTLAGGFMDLARASAPPPLPAPAVQPEPLAPPKPAAPRKSVFDASDTNVTPPVAQTQTLPSYPMATGVARMPIRPGIIEVTIDENGRVSNAVMRQSISPVYDPLVLGAVANWRYKPALLDGKTVKYRKMVQINVEGK